MSNTLENRGHHSFLRIYGASFPLAVALKHAEDAFFRRPQLLRTAGASPPGYRSHRPPSEERAAHGCCEATPARQRTRKLIDAPRAADARTNGVNNGRLARPHAHLRRVARHAREAPPARRMRGGYERGSSQEHSPMSSSRAALPPVWVDVVEKVETDVATLERAP